MVNLYLSDIIINFVQFNSYKYILQTMITNLLMKTLTTPLIMQGDTETK